MDQESRPGQGPSPEMTEVLKKKFESMIYRAIFKALPGVKTKEESETKVLNALMNEQAFPRDFKFIVKNVEFETHVILGGKNKICTVHVEVYNAMGDKILDVEEGLHGI